MTSRFLFQNSFDAPPRARTAARNATQSDDMTAARAAARAEGIEEGRRQAEDAAATRQAEAVERIAANLQALSGTLEGIRAEAMNNAKRLATLVGAKLAGRLLERLPGEAVEALLVETLMENLNEPRIVLRAAEPVIAALQERVAEIASRSGYGGGIVMLADDTLQSADCRIEWADGGAEFDQAALAARLDGLMRNPAPVSG